MQIPAARWHEAIQSRYSQRKYLPKPIPAEILGEIQKFCLSFRPFPEAYAVLVTESPDEVFQGIIGSYGKITGAQAYIAFVGKTGVPHVDEKVGYTGEGIILEATALGLNTCWVGGFFKRGLVNRQISLATDERVYAITPLGYSSNKITIFDKMTKRKATDRKRKNLDLLVMGGESREWEEWQKAALQNARIAPSAMNRQPWKFAIGEKEIVISVDHPKDLLKNLPKRLDCGIALLHLQVGAELAGEKSQLDFLEHPEVARLKLTAGKVG